jgi:hypothetical protein
MPNESAEFRDRLLGAQQMTPALREEYRKELDAVLHYKLTPRTRALAWGGIVVAAAFAVLIIWVIIRHGNTSVKFTYSAYLAVAVGTILWFARMLSRGGFVRQTSLKVTEWLVTLFAGANLFVTLLSTMYAAPDAGHLLGAIWATMFWTTALALSISNRLAAAALDAHAHRLRIESRLADLADRISK